MRTKKQNTTTLVTELSTATKTLVAFLKARSFNCYCGAERVSADEIP